MRVKTHPEECFAIYVQMFCFLVPEAHEEVRHVEKPAGGPAINSLGFPAEESGIRTKPSSARWAQHIHSISTFRTSLSLPPSCVKHSAMETRELQRSTFL
ncbi:hypothetical protein XENORESO_021214 [Xenotaenia resolanae]|uniref:Uncharacterized protein n=1 Tax=Xenotaenia resolanae TaxID=208358 RepID=A0ABV0WBI3_9TELE